MVEEKQKLDRHIFAARTGSSHKEAEVSAAH